MLKLLIFDLDGTLIDSAPDIIATTNALMAERGRKPLPEDTIKAAIGEGLKQLVFGLFPETHKNPKKLQELESDFYRLYEAHLLRETTVFPGVNEFLNASNHLKAIVTNKYEDLTFKTIAGLSIQHHRWLRIFGADSLPERKPHPLPLLEVIKAAEVFPHETVMIGDGIPDLVAAQRAGVHSVACEFGYARNENLKKHDPSAWIRSFSELPAALAKIESLPPRTPIP